MKFSKKIPRMTNLRRAVISSNGVIGTKKDNFRSVVASTTEKPTLLETFLGDRIGTFNGEEMATIKPTLLYTNDLENSIVTFESEAIVLLN